MLENQFITFTNEPRSTDAKALVIPTTMLSEQTEEHSSFHIFVPTSSSRYAGAKIFTMLREGSVAPIIMIELTGSTSYERIELSRLFQEAASPIEKGVRYRLISSYSLIGRTTIYSSVQDIIFADDPVEFSTISYLCNEDAFGFPFGDSGTNYVQMPLPIRLHSPQNVQDDKTYVKANGEVVTLYAKYYKEWEGETEYLSAEMHDKIVAALSCDEVYINGKRVTKSDKYQVDWENYDLDCDGVTKLARATFKVRENITQRNSNF